ncbi:pseudouridine synthase [Bifidobacterium thermophilum]|nr:pseudouridine synthase [Bifidobacterium thermophilum]
MTNEPEIPFRCIVLYEDERIIVIDKPHFVPTTPRGMWYRQSALIRLREHYAEPQITPAHRLDRLTAGIVVFVRDPACRGAYQMLFQNHLAHKTYECLAPAAPITRPHTGTLTRLNAPAVFPLLRCSHIVKDRGRLQAYEVPGEPNARTIIDLPDACGMTDDTPDATALPAGTRRYVLHPVTGKTHQLRVHMSSIGLPIMGDPFYPTLKPCGPDDFSTPLQLVARRLEFTDPVSGRDMVFVSSAPLRWR